MTREQPKKAGQASARATKRPAGKGKKQTPDARSTPSRTARKSSASPKTASKNASTAKKTAAKLSQPPKKAAEASPARKTPAKTPKTVKSKARALEKAVRKDVAKLERVSPVHGALVELAFSLARQLDAGAGMAAAAIGRELRATLDQLTADGGDQDDGLAAAVAALQAEMGDAAQS